MRPILEMFVERTLDRPSANVPRIAYRYFRSRGDAAITLQLGGALKTVTLCTEDGNQPRRQHRAHTGQRIHDGKVRVLASQRLQLFIVGMNGSSHLSQHADKAHGCHGTASIHGRVVRQGHSRSNLLDATLDRFRLIAVVLAEERAQSIRPQPGMLDGP